MSQPGPSRLNLIRKSERSRYSVYRCSCGVEKEIYTTNVTGGLVVSCGCHRREKARQRLTTHGLTTGGKIDPAFRLWRNMLARCNRCHFYTKRGIAVCQRWATSFEAFRSDIGEPPTGKSLDRRNNDGGYWCGRHECPECGPLNRIPNWQWANQVQQGRNTVRNKLITHNGKTQCAAAWADELGMKPNKLWKRLNRGWSVEKSLSTK